MTRSRNALADVDESSYSPPLMVQKRLIVAFLARAFLDLYPTKSTSDAAQIARGAWRWIISKSESEFSVRWCCDVLHLDAGALRQKIFRRQKEPASAAAVLSAIFKDS